MDQDQNERPCIPGNVIEIETDADSGTPTRGLKHGLVDFCCHELPVDRIPQGKFQVIPLSNVDVAFKTQTHLTFRQVKRVHSLPPIDADLQGRGLCAGCRRFDLQAISPGHSASNYDGSMMELSTLMEAARFCPDFETWEHGTKHHESWEDLMQSSESCPLCFLILQTAPFPLTRDAKYCTGTFLRPMTRNPQGSSHRGLGLNQICVTYASPPCRLTLPGETFVTTRESFLDLVADPGSTAAESGDVLGRRISKEWNIARVQEWLSECLERHPGCKAVHGTKEVQAGSAARPIPRRLIRVDPDPEIAPRLELVSPGTRPSYLALSYQWGDAVSVTTHSANLETHQAAIDRTALCKTQQDALELTRQLHFEYIWIDALCIVQDTVDKIDEVPFMSEIYQNATLTLAASNSTSGDSGLTTIHVASNQVRMAYRSSTGEARGEYFVADRFPGDANRSIVNAALNRRAWCLQERILSRRILHFGVDRMYWECLRQVQEEGTTWPCKIASDPVGNVRSDIWQASRRDPPADAQIPTVTDLTPRLMDMDTTSLDRSAMIQVFGRGLYGKWYEMICEFSARQMKYPSDKLPALAGLARMFAASLPHDRYVAGLWQGDLAAGLLWSTSSGFHYWEQNFLTESPAPRAPSWSWASVDGTITFPLGSLYFYCLDILDVHLETDGSSTFGPVICEGSIRVRGRSAPLSSLIGFRPQDQAYIESARANISPSYNVPFVLYDTEHERERADYGEDLFALLVALNGCGSHQCSHRASCEYQIGYALLLRRVHENKYRRVGLAQVWFPQILADTEIADLFLI